MGNPVICAVVNPKGGVAKSTTARELAAQLSRDGNRVAILDLDHSPGCLSETLGADMTGVEGIAHALLGNRDYDIEDCIQEIEFDGQMIGLAAGGAAVGAAESHLREAGNVSAPYRLRELLSEVDSYDYFIIDTPGNLSIMTLMALNAANKVVIPVFAELESVRGLPGVLGTIEEVRRYTNPGISVAGILICRYTTTAASPALFAETIGEIAGERGVSVYKTRIRQSHARDERRNLKHIDYASFAEEFAGKAV